MRFILSFFLTLIAYCAMAQQQATYSQYMFNGLAINPAYAGRAGALSASMLVRAQSVGVDGAPNTQTFSMHSPLLKSNAAVGLLFVHDQIGIFNQYSFNGIYAYRIKLGSESSIAMGLQFGMNSYKANYTDLVIPTADPVFSENVNSLRPNFGAGVFFHNKKLYAGFAVPHLANNVFDRGDDFATIKQDKPILLNAGYVFTLNRFLKLKPNMLFKVVDGRVVEFDLNALVQIDEVIWLGASIKTVNSVSLIADLQLTNQIRLGYAYAITTNSLRAADLGSHEFFLNYVFKYPKKAVVSPRDF